MKDSLYEQLSALVDDELTGAEHELLFRRIEQDEQIYRRLSRYQLISDALQSHLPDRIDPAFSLRMKRLLRAEPALFTRHSASSLTNMLVYEIQGSTGQLVGSVLTLVRDSLTLIALLTYLLYLNWALTLFIGLLFPAIGWVMRTAGVRVQRLTREGQHANDELAYVVEENVLAWRIVRLHDAGPTQSKRFERLSTALRRLALKSVTASAAMTPLTQILAACAMSAVIVVALYQTNQGGQTVGGFVAFITAMLMTLPPIRHLADVMAPILRGLTLLERSVDLVEDGLNERGGAHSAARCAGRCGPAGLGAPRSRRP